MSWVELVSCDGHRLDAFVSGDLTSCQASIVIVQEIFGVNQHIQKVLIYRPGGGPPYVQDNVGVIQIFLF